MALPNDICQCNQRKRRDAKGNIDQSSHPGGSDQNRNPGKLRKNLTVSELVYKFLNNVSAASTENRQRNNAAKNFKKAHVRKSRRQARRPDAPARRLSLEPSMKSPIQLSKRSRDKAGTRAPQHAQLPTSRRSGTRDISPPPDSQEPRMSRASSSRATRKAPPRSDKKPSKRGEKSKELPRQFKVRDQSNERASRTASRKRPSSRMSRYSDLGEPNDALDNKRYKLTLPGVETSHHNDLENDTDRMKETTNGDGNAEENLQRTESASESEASGAEESGEPDEMVTDAGESNKQSRNDDASDEKNDSVEADDANDEDVGDDNDENKNTEDNASEDNVSEDNANEDNTSEDNSTEENGSERGS